MRNSQRSIEINEPVLSHLKPTFSFQETNAPQGFYCLVTDSPYGKDGSYLLPFFLQSQKTMHFPAEDVKGSKVSGFNVVLKLSE